jgi:hypothetical protein
MVTRQASASLALLVIACCFGNGDAFHAWHKQQRKARRILLRRRVSSERYRCVPTEYVH